ncbi:MAG: sodium:proton antiporter NhaD, partial [Candidatus Doudnabacteria bacterium]|nr:sodium:proton antiporter NhaD [Candidatus Doudnabacteria bacterium]
VEILVHYRFFDLLREKLYELHLSEKQQFILILFLTFILSAVLDNLTTTIVMIQISRRFFKNGNMVLAAAGVVIAANAGGAWSPIGDVTTIMLWIAGKFNTWQVISRGFLPSFSLWLVATGLLTRKLEKSDYDSTEEITTKLERSEKFIIALVFGSFTLPVLMNTFHLKPYMGLLLGLGLVWVCVDRLKKKTEDQTHLDASIKALLQKTDIASIKFFVGILLAVSALHTMGALDTLAHLIYGNNPSPAKVILGNIGLGFSSAVLDNVPQTAIAIQMLHIAEPSLWVLLAITVGTGGSLLVIGSAAGVVAMGMVPELNFQRYLKIAFWPALTGYATAVAVWTLQYMAGF